MEITENKMSDKKRSLYNIFISIFLRIVLFALSFIVRRCLIQCLGNEYNGINSLFLSILGVLSIAELGIGTAITFCMYKPIVENDVEKISALYNLMRRIYAIIALVVVVAGVIFSFFIKYLAKDYTIDSVDLFSFYFLFLLSSALTYFCGAQASLINAYKNNFIATFFYSISIVFQYSLQLVALYVFKSFYLFIIAKSVCVSVQYILQRIYCQKRYKDIISRKNKVDSETKEEVKKNVGALFLHQVTAKVFSSVDSLVISSMFGVIILGKYSNYFLIMNSMNEVLKLVFTSLTSILGHMILKKSKEEMYNIYKFLNNVNIVIGFIFYLGFFAIVDDLIICILGDGLLIENALVALITCTYFVQFERQACSNIKDSAGLFYKDRFFVLIAAVLNIVLSILFAYLWGIYGVIIATLVLILLIYHPCDSYLTHKYLFEKKCYLDLLYKAFVAIVFTGTVLLFRYLNVGFDNVFVRILVNGSISVGVSVVLLLLLQITNLKFNYNFIKSFLRR